jgi:hypothetical protein
MVRLPVASWMSSQVMHCPSVGLVGVPRVRLPWRVTRKWLPSAAFQRQEKDTDGIEKRCGAPAGSAPPPEEYERVHPPVLLVFHQVGSAPPRVRRRGSPTSPATTGRDGGTPRAATTPTTAASRSCPPRWTSCANTARADPRSGASAATTASRCWTRSATPAEDAYLARRRQAARKRRTAPRGAGGRGRGGEAARVRRLWAEAHRRPMGADRGAGMGPAARVAPAPVRGMPEPGRRSPAADRSRRTRAPGPPPPGAGNRAAAQKVGGWFSRFRT